MKRKLARILCIALTLVMVLGVAACGDPVDPIDPGTPVDPGTPGDSGTPVDPGTPGGPGEVAPTTLIVGYGAPADGEFIDGFGNSAYDLTIKTLLHDFNGPFYITEFGELDVNPTVLVDYSTSVDGDGNKTYSFIIHEDLLWSDGSQITASDYVASMLWAASPQWMEAGAYSAAGMELVGWEAYNDGDVDYFAGVQLLGDFQFSLTIDAAELPYFGEYGFVSASPMPLHVWAPGISVISDANGASFSGDILDAATRITETERFAPTVVCGPYTFVSFSNNIVTLQRNPHFKGDHEGRKPTIEFIQQIEVSDATDVDQLFAGEVDYLPEEIMGGKIERVKAEPGFAAHSFLRNGYGVMNFSLDWGPTADQNVRWAIACLVDRNALLDQILFGYGGLIDTEAGEAQWMYQMKRAELQETLIPIALSVDRANGYLDRTEWVFEADGSTPFDASQANSDGTYLRHNAAGEVLTINHAAANAEIGAVLEIEFLRNTPLAGINYNFDNPEFTVVLDQYYYAFELPDEERMYHTFSMGTGFGVPFDPYYSWHSDLNGTWMNPVFSDEKMDELIINLRRTEPGDNATFLARWFDYVVYWNEILPAFPLYANEYFDLHSARVQGVNTNPFQSWYQVICGIYIVD
jgi:peptide/nickel transport system substrate-binding protein